eukprot:SAG11_NODE_28740_length_318_cov_0.945205_1_plen_26_part_10
MIFSSPGAPILAVALRNRSAIEHDTW